MRSVWYIFAALALVGCADSGDPSVCGSLPARLPYPPKTTDDQKQVTYSCMERWAARLARGTDSADEVSKAAFAACREALVYYRSYLIKDGVITETGPMPTEATDEFWLGRTMFIAVQTRAGNCYPDA